MFGELWFITQKMNGKTYYFVGRENRGRRVWHTSMREAVTFQSRDAALKHWKEYAGCAGGVTGWQNYGI